MKTITLDRFMGFFTLGFVIILSIIVSIWVIALAYQSENILVWIWAILLSISLGALIYYMNEIRALGD